LRPRSWTAVVVISISLLWLERERAHADNAVEPPAHPSQADVSAAANHFKSGQRLIDKGDYAGAIGEIEQAYQLDPQNVHLYNLGVAHQNNGDRDKAIDYYRRYLAVAPDGKLASEAERYLNKLEAEEATDKAEEATKKADQARADALKALAEANAARDQERKEHAEKEAAQQREELRTGPPQAVAVPARAVIEPPVPTGNEGITEDASADHGWVMPTALTAPAGTWTLSDFELLGVQAGYAITDRLAVSVGAVLPVSSFKAAILDTKLQLIQAGRVRVAAQGLLAHAWSSDDAALYKTSGRNVDMLTLGSAGGVATLCIDAGCRSHLSGYLGVGLLWDGDPSAALLAGASLTFSLTTHWKAMFEIEDGAGYDFVKGTLGWYGVRITSSSFCLDFGIAKPLGAATAKWGSSSMPFLGLTLRSSVK